jgi:hypothetical protein
LFSIGLRVDGVTLPLGKNKSKRYLYLRVKTG